MKEALIALVIILGVFLLIFIIGSVLMIVAIAWCHHPEGIIKAYKNRRKQENERKRNDL